MVWTGHMNIENQESGRVVSTHASLLCECFETWASHVDWSFIWVLGFFWFPPFFNQLSFKYALKSSRFCIVLPCSCRKSFPYLFPIFLASKSWLSKMRNSNFLPLNSPNLCTYRVPVRYQFPWCRHQYRGHPCR